MYGRCIYFFNSKNKVKINFIKNLYTSYILLKKINTYYFYKLS